MPNRPSDTIVGYYAGPSIEVAGDEEENPTTDDGLMHPIEEADSSETPEDGTDDGSSGGSDEW